MQTTRRLWRRLVRLWRHQGGLETVEWVATVLVIVSLLGAVMLSFKSQGGTVGQSATNTMAHFITDGAGNPNIAPGKAGGTVSVGTIGLPALGIPAVFAGQPGGQIPAGQGPNGQQTGSQPQQQQQDCSGWGWFGCAWEATGGKVIHGIQDAWNSAPPWLQGAIAAGVGALVAVVVIAAIIVAAPFIAVSATVLVIAGAITVAIVATVGGIIAAQNGKPVDFGEYFKGGLILGAIVYPLAIMSVLSIGNFSAAVSNLKGFQGFITNWAVWQKIVSPLTPFIPVLAKLAAGQPLKWDEVILATFVSALLLPISIMPTSQAGWMQFVGPVILGPVITNFWPAIKSWVGIPDPTKHSTPAPAPTTIPTPGNNLVIPIPQIPSPPTGGNIPSITPPTGP